MSEPDEKEPEHRTDHGPTRQRLTRRQLLKSAGIAGAAAVFPGALGAERVLPRALPVVGPVVEPGVEKVPAGATRPPQRQVPVHFQNLTVAEARVLDRIVERLIPSDELGPGAREAGALGYIDRELGGSLAGSREAYRTGLAALDRYCRYSRGAPFLELSPTEQDSVLLDLQTGGATGSGAGFAGSSAAFFNMVKGHTWQATFGDPAYGGNLDYVGWDILGYPGMRRTVTPGDQERLESGSLPPARRSAYE